jgi:hypothetical protein
MDKKKIDKAKKKILDFFEASDPSGENKKIYEEKFENMTDKEFVNMVDKGLIKYYVKPFEIEPTLDDVRAALDFVGVPDKEKITLPFLYEDEEVGAVKSKHKVTILDIHLKRLQQLIYKENTSVSDIGQRDKTNQPIKDSKAAQLSGNEVAMLTAKGFDKVQTELLSFRADHDRSKEEAYENIATGNKTNIPESVNDPDDKVALNYLSVLLYGMGLDHNLIEDMDE